MTVLSPRAQAIFETKYYCLTKGQSFEDRVKQIVENICDNWTKEERDKLIEYVIQKKFCFGGRIWYGVGRNKLPLSNCFVLPIEDDMDSILLTESMYGKIESLGGGVGINFSKLRGRNSPIYRGQKDIAAVEASCGSVGFMCSFNEKVRQITGGANRKGATLFSLEVLHSDVEEFITIKQDRTQLDMANLSVMFNNEFFDLLAKGDKRANKIWNLFCENAFEHGEPGWLHYENINRDNSIFYHSDIQATNPCFTGDTLIAVADGRNAVPIKQLADEGKDIPVYCCDKKTGKVYIRAGRNPRLTKQNAHVYKVTLDDESSIKTTGDHKFLLRDGTQKETLKLQIGDSLIPFNKWKFSPRRRNTSYWYVNRNNGSIITEHRLLMEFTLKRNLLAYPQEIVHHKDWNGLNNAISNLEIVMESTHNRIHNKGISNPKKGNWWNFLSQEEKNEYGQKMSESCKGTKNQIEELALQYNHKIKSVEFCGYEDVYNITVDEFHVVGIITKDISSKLSGIYISNCGEMPIIPFSQCVLGAINCNELSNDINELKSIVYFGVKFLNEVNLKTPYVFPELKKVGLGFRRIGLGIMGWADFLIKNNLKYGTNESLIFADNWFRTFRDYSYEASIKLTDTYKCFPLMNKKEFMKCDFIKRLPDELQKDIKKKGIVNCALNTIAPTGTTSQLFDCSFGLEPIYDSIITRHDRLGKETIQHPMSNHPAFITQKTGLTMNDFFEMKVTAQKYIDGAISGTFSIGSDIKFGDFKELLKKYILKTKGGTVYREGSRLKEMIKGKSSRPYTLPSNTSKETINLKDGHLHRYVTIVDENDKPFEVFCSALAEDYKAFVPPDSLCISLSMLMRAGIPVTTIVDKFKKYVNLTHSNLPSIIVKLLEKRLKDTKARIVEKDSCSMEDIKSGECKTCE